MQRLPENLHGMWSMVDDRLKRELGETCPSPRLVSSTWTSRITWALSLPKLGDLVVKIRQGDRVAEKAQWCALNLPLLAARGVPVPSVIWHGPLDEEWHVIVQRHLPGRSLESLTWPLLKQIVELVELQADAVPLPTSEDRDFAGYVAHVLFDDWDEVWGNATSAGAAAEALCTRLRHWLAPIWGLRLPARDFTHNDLNLSNIVSDGQHITGVVDWDEFGLGSRAIDLVVLGFDCTRDGRVEMTDHLLARAAKVAGDDGLRCLVSYRAIATLAEDTRACLDAHRDVTTTEHILDRLHAPR